MPRSAAGLFTTASPFLPPSPSSFPDDSAPQSLSVIFLPLLTPASEKTRSERPRHVLQLQLCDSQPRPHGPTARRAICRRFPIPRIRRGRKEPETESGARKSAPARAERERGREGVHGDEGEFRRDDGWCTHIAHAPTKSRSWRISAATKRREQERERETEGNRERERQGLVAGEKRNRGKWRRQLGQILNNLDNGRTALNSCRFVQAHRLIRLAGRLQRGLGWNPGEFSVPPWRSSEEDCPRASRLPRSLHILYSFAFPPPLARRVHRTRTNDVLISLSSAESRSHRSVE